MGVKSKTNYMTSIILWAKIGTITQIKLAEECFPHNVSGIFYDYLSIYCTTITFCVPSLIDCHCISFFTINRTAERKMYLKDNTFLVETFQKRMNEMEFGSKIVLTYCETKIVLVIEKIFFKLFTLSLAYLKSFSWFLKQFFQTVMKGQQASTVFETEYHFLKWYKCRIHWNN